MPTGFGASDKMGESPSIEEYENDLVKLAEPYKEQQLSGRHFVHVRKKHSSNRGLRALKGVTSKKEVFSVGVENKELKGDRIGVAADSVVTNSAHLADVMKKSNCKTCGDVEDAIDREMKRQHCNSGQDQFEHHMVEDDAVRIDWQNGELEKDRMICETCGDRDAWDRVRACCDQQ